MTSSDKATGHTTVAIADRRERARALRGAGWTVPEIAAELGASKSSAYLWTRDMPLDATPEEAAARRSRHSRRVAEARWAPYRQARDQEREVTRARVSGWVGELSDREVILLGAVTYWCEGTKAKPWRPGANGLQFINSDPRLILLFRRYVVLLGAGPESLRYRLSIHESADVGEATSWWAGLLGVPVEVFQRPTLKRHNPATVRRNVGEAYRGCLVINVLKSARLYWEVEAVMEGIALSEDQSAPAIM
ncbi:resolvase [Actinoplanes sp. CA-015351]|uniref:resolvase n=1 Tax=Actinoplanes sp. CA-015351 TaxID=3239897 RepID=UPI003D95E173